MTYAICVTQLSNRQHRARSMVGCLFMVFVSACTSTDSPRPSTTLSASPDVYEFAQGWTTVSSLGGQTLSPYDLSRDPGGSSDPGEPSP